MHIRHGGARIVLAAALALATAVTGLVVTAAPAAASLQTFRVADSLTWTDSHTPKAAHFDVDGPAPVGAWRDDAGKRHVSRSYFTFDLTPYRGKTIKTAYAVAREAEVADCRKPRRVEVWQTTPVTSKTSWDKPPKELAKLGEFTISYYGCPSGYLEVDMLAQVRAALARNESTFTVELRMPKGAEKNVHLGRSFERRFGIVVDANSAPHVPTELKVNQALCAGPEPMLVASRGPMLSVRTSDPDVNETGGSDFVYATFAIWPVDDPSARREYADVGLATDTNPYIYLYLPWDSLVDGTYAFQAKATDNEAETDWSPECRFTVDTVAPTGIPSVTSTDYPDDGEWHGGAGIPGEFTFRLPGAAGFRYGLNGPYSYVAADADGSATVTVTPDALFSATLYVAGVDEAGNQTDVVYYQFMVRDTGPTIVDLDAEAWLGQPHRIALSPNMADVVSYVYTVDYGPEQTVAANADGTAQVVLTPQETFTEFRVRAFTSAGLRSGESWIPIYVTTSPFVSSPDWPENEVGAPIGTAGTFTFRPHMPGVTEYVWYVDGMEPQTVPAGPDGGATVSYTPTVAWNSYLAVFSRTAEGAESEVAFYSFQPQTLAPVIDAGELQPNQTSGPVGQPITFTFSPRLPQAASYTYRINQGAEVTVPAGADGTATVTWTPKVFNSDWGGSTTLDVFSTSTDGRVSDRSYFSFYVDRSAPIAEPSVTYPDTATVGRPVTVALTSRIGGTVEFVWTVDNGPEQILPADAAGRATLTWTPDSMWSHWISIYSRNTDGLVTGSADVFFYAVE